MRSVSRYSQHELTRKGALKIRLPSGIDQAVLDLAVLSA